jgi:hypothetical protein
MNDIKDGGPAFPVSDIWKGMTLRDYFAAQAMQGLLSDPDTARNVRVARRLLDEAVADMAYMFADAMIARKENK